METTKITDITPDNQNAIYSQIKNKAHINSHRFDSFDVANALESKSKDLCMIYSQCNDPYLSQLLHDKTPLSIATKEAKERLGLPADSKLPKLSYGEDVIHDMKMIEAAALINPDGKITIGFSFSGSLDLRREIDFKSIKNAGSVMKAYQDEIENKTDLYFKDVCKNQSSMLKNSNGEMVLNSNAFEALYTKSFVTQIVDKKINEYIKDHHMESVLDETKSNTVAALADMRKCKALGIDR